MAPHISVILPTYRRPRLLDACLRSLAGQDLHPADFEVVAVDDGSGPETEAVLRLWADRTANIRWAAQPVNKGPAAARNRAASMAAGGWLLFVDDDIVAPPNLVAEHLARHRADPDESLGVVGLVEWEPGLEVTPFMRWLDRTDVQFAYATMTEGPVEPPTRAFYTCNVSISRSLFERAGGFDERFPYPAYEDTELAVRLVRLGFRLEYRPAALAFHGRAITLADFRRRMTQVGEAAVILRAVQPDLPVAADLDRSAAHGWRRTARRLALAGGPLLERTPLRDRYYQQVVNDAFTAGVARARRRPPAGR